MVKKVSHASFDERVSVVNLLFSGTRQAVRKVMLQEEVLEKVFEVLKALKKNLASGNLAQRLEDYIFDLKNTERRSRKKDFWNEEKTSASARQSHFWKITRNF